MPKVNLWWLKSYFLGNNVHILFLTDNFPPEVNAPASRTFEHCRQWVRAGEQVTIITCAPNFPSGKVFAGYANKLWHIEVIDGIKVIRVWTYITANEGFARRSLDYLSFMFAAIIAALWVRKVDIVIGTSPQFFTVCAAYFVALLKRVPWIFELRDIWPESIKAVGAMQESWLSRTIERVELFLYIKATRIVALTNAFKKTLIERGIAENKIDVVTNGVDLNLFQARPKNTQLLKKLGLENQFIAGYIGTLGLAHGLDTLLEAAQILQTIPEGQQIKLLFLGDGARKAVLKKRAHVENFNNVVFIDTVKKADVPEYWSILDVSIIHLKKDPLFEKVIPSKLFESMAMGIPVIHGVAGESAELVRNSQSGVIFESENAQQLAQCLLAVKVNSERYLNLKKNATQAAKIYNRNEIAERMRQVILKTCSA